ncbi:MAG: peroxiredoxin [Ignavibacteria bacterium]|nr:peroxiredoxin [Ignavibacteria bacterium]
MAITIGDCIPDFKGYNQFGAEISTSDIKGKNTVLFFYPKDDTYMCTREACSFRDANEDFLLHGIQVIGISADSIAQHAAFTKKHGLNYMLLSDENNFIRTLFGVPRGMMGLLPGRVTYCFDEHGKLLSIIEASLSAEYHVQEALKVYKVIKS